MADPIVGFLLVQEKNSPIDVVLGGVIQNLAETHGDVSCITAPREAGLIRVNKIKEKESKSIGQNPGENLSIAIGQSDWAPVAYFPVIASWFGQKTDERARPRVWRGCSIENGVKKGK